MKTLIKIQKSRVITGIGLVIEFVVVEGLVRPGMKFVLNKTKDKTLMIGGKIFSFQNAKASENSINLDSVPQNQFIKRIEAGPKEGIIQANISTTENDPTSVLMENSGDDNIFELR